MSNPVEQLKEFLVTNNLKISVAESLTAGLIQDHIASVSGISACFEGGVTAYSLAQKVNLLQVNEEHARQVDCVSEQVVAEMADGVAKLFNTEIAIASTGYAEPYPQQDIIDPYAFVAVYIQGKIYVQKVMYSDFFPDLDPATDELCRPSMRSAATAVAVSLLLNKLGIESSINELEREVH